MCLFVRKLQTLNSFEELGVFYLGKRIMAYQALYRKWRPRNFDSVIGQEAITDTLKNAIERGTVSHAFLFAGPRGTGKTSCAKIFAKALNCTNLQNGEPCNECENCRAADNGSMADFMEIDAASNNGVDEIREIRDKVKYAPTQGKYKVYIIDEVHMLSMGAFNALLKTLEEPPEHVVFILATTELQKVPATIISRTQRYNFKRISKADLEKRMKYILDQEKIEYDEKALGVIAQVADGGMRDALSILDQLLSYEKSKVNYDDALKITGFAEKENIEKLLLAIFDHNAQESLNIAKESLNKGASVKNILDEIIDMTATALTISKAANVNESSFISDDFVEKLQQVSADEFFNVINLANNALKDLRYTNQQQIPLEVFLVEVSNFQPTATKHVGEADNSRFEGEIAALKKQIDNLTQQINTLSSKPIRSTSSSFHINNVSTSNSKKATKSTAPAKTAVKKKPAQNKKQVYRVLENATKADLQTIKDIWPDLLSVLDVSEKAVLDVLEPVAASPDEVVMKCKYVLWFEKASADGDLLNKLTSYIERFTKHSYGIVLVPDNDWLTVRQEFVNSHKQELLAKKKKQIVAAETDNDQPNEDNEIINKAKDLFGDTVNIKD